MSEFTFNLANLKALELYQLRENLERPGGIAARDPRRCEDALELVNAEIKRRTEAPFALKRRPSSKNAFVTSAVLDDQGSFD